MSSDAYITILVVRYSCRWKGVFPFKSPCFIVDPPSKAGPMEKIVKIFMDVQRVIFLGFLWEPGVFFSGSGISQKGERASTRGGGKLLYLFSYHLFAISEITSNFLFYGQACPSVCSLLSYSNRRSRSCLKFSEIIFILNFYSSGLRGLVPSTGSRLSLLGSM